MTNRYLYITLMAIAGLSTDTIAQSAQPKSVPRLVVNIAIDQLRSDYLEAFTPLYSGGGLKRLLSDGKVFINATHPFTPVDRSSGIAAINTGTTPYYNSIVSSQWLKRETLRPTGCVDDPDFPGVFTSDTASPLAVSTSTLGDELKVATGGKALVYAVAPFREAAVLSAGHAADAALWIDDYFGDWCSSTYYVKTAPEWLRLYNEQKPLGKRMSSIVWEPLHEAAASYNFFLQTGSTSKPFKHKFTGENRFVSFKESGLVNAEVTDMALQCISVAGLGSDNVTDLLCLTYFAGTSGHQRVTDCQMELQDTYARLDRELGRLIAAAEKAAGAGNVLFVVSSTGYDHVEAADYASFRVPTGTFYMNRTADLVNMYLGAIWGQGKYVETTFRNQLFLNHKLLDSKQISISDACNRSREIVSMMAGVRNVYTSLQLLTIQSAQTEKIRNAFNPQRNGDIIIEASPGWNVLNEDTQQSEIAVASFTQFPIIFCGVDSVAERITTPVTTDRIAPTIARTIRIRAPNACSSEPLF